MRVATFATLLVLSACGKHPGSYTTTAEVSGEAAATQELLDSADAAWESRDDEQQLQLALKQYAQVIEADPTNRKSLIRLTRGWYFWGDAFTEDKDTKVERWGTAIEYGARCIALNEAVAEQINSGAKEKDAIAAATKPDAGCIYWTATALGKWGKIQSLSKTLKHLPTVKAYVAKVEELDPTYYHYGPARYWAAYYAALPSFAGQDLDKSGEYFDTAVKAAPYYLPTRVLRAEYHSVGTQNATQFAEDLMYVLNADPDGKPNAGITPENRKEMEKAQSLWDKRGELFEKDAVAEAEAVAERFKVSKPEPTEAPEAEAAPTVTKPEADAEAAEEAPADEAPKAVDTDNDPRAEGEE